jgi:hypothetical protein
MLNYKILDASHKLRRLTQRLLNISRDLNRLTPE